MSDEPKPETAVERITREHAERWGEGADPGRLSPVRNCPPGEALEIIEERWQQMTGGRPRNPGRIA